MASSVGVVALWLVVSARTPAAWRAAPVRWWLVTGLAVGLASAACWLWIMAGSRHSYGPQTWAVWLVLLLGPLVMGSYYLVLLGRR